MRLGPVRFVGTGLTLLVVMAFFYGLSVLFWSWVLMLVLGAAHVDYSYSQCVLPWGLLMPFVLG